MQNQELVIGLPTFKVDEMHKVCEACQFGKQSKASFPHDKHVSKDVFEIFHFDVWGPAKTTSMGGCRFYVTFIDDHTGKVWVYFMNEKSKVSTQFQNFKAMVEEQTRKYVQCLRLDEGEITSPMSLHVTKRSMGFDDNICVGILPNKMVLLRGRTSTLQRLQGQS